VFCRFGQEGAGQAGAAVGLGKGRETLEIMGMILLDLLVFFAIYFILILLKIIFHPSDVSAAMFPFLQKIKDLFLSI